ncbi:S10 family peptidase [Steroidobacter flavus]|uniref:S10 family peptidase n=1 Tax=Steroidobacter flavus TaxID=1842136 RepID=A0ABV8T0T7_9GAMM
MSRRSIAAAALAWVLLGTVQSSSGAEPAVTKPDVSELPPLPADATIEQSIQVEGRKLTYSITVGALPLRGDDGRKTGEVVLTAYVLKGADRGRRPVTFAFNGGPGASSAYLALGAIGPKQVQFGGAGDSPSDPLEFRDNAGTWLDFTDLVFIDPIGTGYSRSLLPADVADKTFFSLDGDVAYLSRIIYDWLAKHGRFTSRTYLVGESFGGWRAPAIAQVLQTRMGVGVSGIVMISPYLTYNDRDVSPLGWAAMLPSMAAAHYEKEGRRPDAVSMSEVENYARGEYVVDFLKGVRDPSALDRLVTNVTRFTGLDADEVRRKGGRIEGGFFVRSLHREAGQVGSYYDPNVTGFDPYPLASESRAPDPILAGTHAPLTAAMSDLVTRQVGWKVDGHYEVLNYEVNRRWEKRWSVAADTFGKVREVLAVDSKAKVLVAHGYSDLACPYFRSVMMLAQLPALGADDRVRLTVYPGGHMFYSRAESQAAFRRDVRILYGSI